MDASARQLLGDVGFVGRCRAHAPGDPQDAIFVTTKPLTRSQPFAPGSITLTATVGPTVTPVRCSPTWPRCVPQARHRSRRPAPRGTVTQSPRLPDTGLAAANGDARQRSARRR